MASSYYKPCRELERCLELDQYWEKDKEQAKHWYRLAALQDHDLAIEKCKELD